MKKILFISNTANFAKFNRPLMRWCENKGFQVDYCAPDDEMILDCNRHYVLSIPRRPLSLKTFSCIFELRKIIRNEKYDIIHCHTPMGSVIARLAAKPFFKKNKIKVVYTAHGFHFFKNAPLINWCVYYPVEKYLSRFTSVLITINEEDFQFAKRKFHTKDVRKFNGVGVDLTKYYPFIENRKEKISIVRESLQIQKDAFVILYIAEFIKRKNHKLIFDIFPKIRSYIPNVKLILAGKGELLDYYKKFVEKNNYSNDVIFTGYTNLIHDYCRVSDLLLMPSFQEGLPISMIEAMATGIPIVASNIRGHVDVVENGKNGFLCEISDPNQFVEAIKKIYDSEELRTKIFNENLKKAPIFSVEQILESMCKVYE